MRGGRRARFALAARGRAPHLTVAVAKEGEAFTPVAYDVRRYLGKTVELVCDKEFPLVFSEEGQVRIPHLLRPGLRLTALYGRLNDPNGLVVDGSDGPYLLSA